MAESPTKATDYKSGFLDIFLNCEPKFANQYAASWQGSVSLMSSSKSKGEFWATFLVEMKRTSPYNHASLLLATQDNYPEGKLLLC